MTSSFVNWKYKDASDNFEQACVEHGKLMEVDYPKPFVTNINAKGKAEPQNADWGCWRSNLLSAGI